MSDSRIEKKNNKENLSRLLRQKWKRYNDLFDQSLKLGTVKLETPIRKGWVRQFALSEESRNRKDAHVIARVLDVINTKMYCRDRNWADAKLKSWHQSYIDSARIENQSMNSLTDKEYEKLDAREKKFFVKRYLHIENSRTIHQRWVIEKPTKFFRLKESKHYIKEVPVFDAQIDRERSEIWNWIWNSGLYYKLAKTYGWRMHWEEDYTGRKQHLLTKEMKKEIREYVDEMLEIKHAIGI